MKPATTTLLLYALYLGVAFGLRTINQVRTTGSTGFHGFSRGPTARFAGALFVAALVLGAVAPLFEAATQPWLHATGAAIVLLGIAGTYASQLAMGRSWRIGVAEGERTELVTSGAFGIVRNPIFTWMIVTALGFLLIVPNLAAAISILALVTAIEVQVRVVEEPHLKRVHGAPYEQYCARVGRFLPHIG